MKKVLAFVLLAGLAFIGCQKEFSIENGQASSLSGAWEFKDSTNTKYAGNPVVYTIDTTNPASADMLYTGTTANQGATITIEVIFPTRTAAVGSYQSANGEVNFSYLFSNSGKLFQVNGQGGQFSTENITVNITAISDSSVTGTFSGMALDSASRPVPIKEGKFSYRKQSVVVPVPTASAGTLATAADSSCTGAVVNGTYRKNTALAATNTVTLSVNVTTAGSYTISSDTLKGIYFKSAGNFTATGLQSITLPGIGTPTDSATALRFRVRYGNSSCTFLLKIDTASGVVVVPPPIGDYFPLTANNNWSYNITDPSGSITDTSYVLSTGTTQLVSGSPYNIFTQNDVNIIDSGLYRKNAGTYYDANILVNFGLVNTPTPTRFLIDNIPVNSNWSDTFSAPGVGPNVKLKIDYKILAKAVPATINSFSWTDVIKVSAVYSTNQFGPYLTEATGESWYARGTGFIYLKLTDVLSASSEETKIRRYNVVP